MTGGVKVSVLCTAYNHEAYIAQALESFVSQRTDFPFEVLVTDDASTDGTAAVIRDYAARYPTIIRPFLLTENQFSQGVSLFETILYKEARGEYFAECEGDDYWIDPEKLQRQVDFLDSHPDYTACVHNTVAHTMDETTPDRVLYPQTGDRDIPFELVLQGMSRAFHTSSVVVRRDYMEHVPEFRDVGFAHGYVTDYPQGLWYTLQGRVRFLDRCMSVYRINAVASSWSSGVNKEYDKFKQFVTGELAVLHALLPYPPEAKKAAVEQTILEREYELLYLEGKVEQMMQPPYDAIFKTKSFSHRSITALKRAFPALHRLYRRRQGYKDY